MDDPGTLKEWVTLNRPSNSTRSGWMNGSARPTGSEQAEKQRATTAKTAPAGGKDRLMIWSPKGSRSGTV
jgi:hypothetical protein